MLLYPRLPHTVGRILAAELATLPIEDLAAHAALTHPDVSYAPTGGHRVESGHLAELKGQLHTAARSVGYPGSATEIERRTFDAISGRILYQTMNITPAEGAQSGVWAFLACVLLPDLVRWRFPGSEGGTSPERFLGAARGTRNMFGRVWWRASILSDPAATDSLELLTLLGEDELVQIMERPGLAGSPLLARAVGRSFLRTADQYSGITRSDLLRDAMKRLRRLLPIVSFDALDARVLELLVNSVFEQAAHSLSSGIL